jgi:hypothetical protein
MKLLSPESFSETSSHFVTAPVGLFWDQWSHLGPCLPKRLGCGCRYLTRRLGRCLGQPWGGWTWTWGWGWAHHTWFSGVPFPIILDCLIWRQSCCCRQM